MPLTDRQTDFSERRVGNLNKTGQRVEDTTSRSRTNSLSSSLSNTGSTTSGTTRNTNQFNTSPTFRGGEGVLSSLINRFQEGSPTPTGRTGVDYFNKVLGQNAGEGGFIGDLVKNIRDQSDYNLPGELNRARGQFGGRGPGGRTALNIDDAVVKNRLGRDSLTSQLQQNQYNQDRSLQSNIANILANLGARETDQSLGLLNTLKGQSGASANVQDQYSTTNAVTSEQRRTQTEQLVNSLVNSIFNEQSNYDQSLQSVKTEEGNLVEELGAGSDILQVIFEKLIPGIIPKKKDDVGNDPVNGGGPTVVPTIFNQNPNNDPETGGGPTITPIINQDPPRENLGGPTITPIINQNPPRENTGSGPGVTPIINQDPPGETPPPGRVAGPNDRNPWNDFFRPVITGDVNRPGETAPPGTNVGTDPNTFRRIPQDPPADRIAVDAWHPSTPVSIYNNNEATSAKDIETKSNTGGKSNKLVTAAMIAATLATGGVPLIIPTGRNQGPTKAQMANRELDDAMTAHEIDGLEQDIRRIQDGTADLIIRNRIDADAIARGVSRVGTSYSQAIEQGAILPGGQVDYGKLQVVDFGGDVTTKVPSDISKDLSSRGMPKSVLADIVAAGGTGAAAIRQLGAALTAGTVTVGSVEYVGIVNEIIRTAASGVTTAGIAAGGGAGITAISGAGGAAGVGTGAGIGAKAAGIGAKVVGSLNKAGKFIKGLMPVVQPILFMKTMVDILTPSLNQRTITTGGMGGDAKNREAALNSVRAETPKELKIRRQKIEDAITGMEQSGDPPETIREFRSQSLYILGLIDEVTTERAGSPNTPADTPVVNTQSSTYQQRAQGERDRRSAERSRKAREAVIRAGRRPPNTPTQEAAAETLRRSNQRAASTKRAKENAQLQSSPAQIYRAKLDSDPRTSSLSDAKKDSMTLVFLNTQKAPSSSTGGPVQDPGSPEPVRSVNPSGGSLSDDKLATTLKNYEASTRNAFPNLANSEIQKKVTAYRETLIAANVKSAARRKVVTEKIRAGRARLSNT